MAAQRVDDLSNRIGTLASADQIENTEKQVRQTFELLAEMVAQRGAKVASIEQQFASILDHMSNSAATIHALEERVKSMQEQVETFPAALREARQSEREIFQDFEQRLAVLGNGAIKKTDNSSD